jgi:uncharacterized protein (TIGR00369 family)
MSPTERFALLERLNRQVTAAVPFNRALGLELGELGDGTARVRLPYDAALAGNPDTGVLHGGVVTALLDVSCAAAVFMKLDAPRPIATLDLRIDYMGPATPGRALQADAICYRVTRHVAFVRSSAFHAEGEPPIATATGTFMISAPNPSRIP